MAAIPGAVSYYTAAGAPNPAFVEMFAAEKGINLLGIAHVIDLGGGTNYHRTNQACLLRRMSLLSTGRVCLLGLHFFDCCSTL